jgi:hypothetical protein
MVLSTEQSDDALTVLHQYLEIPVKSDAKTPEQQSAVLDQRRVDWIDADLKPLVERYLSGHEALETFKWDINAFNMRNKGWGFLGPNGQLFFNMLLNCAPDTPACDRHIRGAIRMPADEDAARSQIRTFEAFVRRVRQVHKSAHGTMRGCPKVGSIPFFLSYFWQIQDRKVWPIYYTNAVTSMVKLGLWQLTGNIADDYITFKHLYEDLMRLFTSASGKPFDLYSVEHVFWFTGAHPME